MKSKFFDFIPLNRHLNFKHTTNLIDEFISNHFEVKSIKNKNNFAKFPIEKQNIRIKSGKNRAIDFNNKLKDKTEIKLKENKGNELYLNNLDITNGRKIINYSKISRKNIRKNLNIFKMSKSTKNIKKINYQKKPNKNDILSLDDSTNLDLKSPKENPTNKFKFISPEKIKKSHRNKFQSLNDNKNFSSFVNYLKNINKKKSQIFSESISPNSTLIKTGLKNNSFKSDIDKNSFSFDKRNNDMKYKKKNLKIIDDDLIQFPYSIHNKKEYKKMKLKNLISQIYKLEKKSLLKPNENIIKSKINFHKFRRKNITELQKSASKNIFMRLTQKNRTFKIPHYEVYDKKSLQLMKNIRKVNMSAKYNKNMINKKNHYMDIDELTYYLEQMHQKDLHKKIDEAFKEEVVQYQAKIGKFFIYEGNGIFYGHLNTMLRGDKISKKLIKFDNI